MSSPSALDLPGWDSTTDPKYTLTLTCPGLFANEFDGGPTVMTRYASGGSLEDAVDDWRHEWEIDPATLEIGPKVGEGEFGTVHKVHAHTQQGKYALTAAGLGDKLR